MELKSIGVKCKRYQNDISEPYQNVATFDNIVFEVGKTNIVIANAGAAVHPMSAVESSHEDDKREIDINFNGAFNTTHNAGRGIIQC